jgi:hypothetical protein
LHFLLSILLYVMYKNVQNVQKWKIKKVEMIHRVVSECGAWRIENMKKIK